MSEPPALPEPIKPPRGDFSLEERKWREGITRAINILTEEIIPLTIIGNLEGDSYISVTDGTNAVLGSGVTLSFNDSNLAKLNANNTWTGTNNFSDIVPRANNYYSLGANDLAWKYVYVNELRPGQSNLGVIRANSLIPILSSDTLGTGVNYWKDAYVTNVHFSTNNIIAEDPNSTGLYIGWRNANNVGRYVRFAEDAVHPVGVSVVGMTLGTASDKWDTVYTNNINLNGTSYNKIPVIPTGTIGAAYYNILGTNSNGSLDKSSYLYFSGDSFFLSPTVKLRAESTNSGEFYWYNTVNNETAALQLTGDCVRAYSGAQAGKIDLGNPYGYWRDLYLGVGRHIYFWGGSSINDTTGNTLDFHALTQYRFYINNAESLYYGGGQLTPTSPTPVDLGNGNMRWNTVFYTTLNPPSDIRLKDNIEPLESGLKIINGLDIKSFTFKNTPDHIEYGIIAQDIVNKYPELVSVPKSDEGTYGTYLHNFIFLSLRAIQELSAKINSLEEELWKQH